MLRRSLTIATLIATVAVTGACGGSPDDAADLVDVGSEIHPESSHTESVYATPHDEEHTESVYATP